ncbi:Trm112 family protein [Pseudodesulfovibrio sp. JC047]|uniref:Trm112 family protein n=1 Tax=Pseudodesulfovibrio sp. JC047 TaxID=2683199 RepID=UPI0013D513A7|nr:Trm112 family protein [Pseudodesulfovibrio sp. JC047]NDV18171.1 Trm112 family protein [Pseudodesulfovibrio sp. JC047]
MSVNKKLLDILVCPTCKGPVTMLPGEDGLKCAACKCVYPVKDDIPIMLADQAVPEKEWNGSK